MGFFAKAKKEDPHSYVQFLFDQDGPMERSIKGRLAELFRDIPQVLEAYFARVVYHGGVQDVALCVYGTPEIDNEQVLRGTAQVYSRIVKTEQPLHTIFLSDAQHKDIAKTCTAFYRSSVG